MITITIVMVDKWNAGKADWFLNFSDYERYSIAEYGNFQINYLMRPDLKMKPQLIYEQIKNLYSHPVIVYPHKPPLGENDNFGQTSSEGWSYAFASNYDYPQGYPSLPRLVTHEIRHLACGLGLGIWVEDAIN